MKTFLRILCVILFCLTMSCGSGDKRTPKINGVSFVASRDSIADHHVAPVVDLNANYAAVMPFGFIGDIAHPEIVFNNDRQWFGETVEGVAQYVETLHEQQLMVMVKPQLWVRHGVYTGFIKMTNEADWKLLETTYSKFILTYAKVARDVNAQIFCIGTELEGFIEERPDYWHQLIREIKAVYKGKLTYAANWDEYERTPFWGDLDYIGIDAYFPISASKTPSVEACRDGWKDHKKTLKLFSERFKKPVLFAEFGYRSVDYAAKEPWKADRNMTQVNMEAQSNALQALFEEVWEEEWFAGGFVWKWFHDYEHAGGISDSQYTPQNKPAERVIKAFYGL